MGIQIHNKKNVFLFFSFSSLLIWFIGLMLKPTGSQLEVFFHHSQDMFSDFINVQIYTSENDPYFNLYNSPAEKCYLPFSYLLLKPFSLFYNYSSLIGGNYLENLRTCYSTPTALVSCLLFVLISLVLLFDSLSKLLKVRDNCLLISLLFSSTVLYSLERGNLAIFSVAMICYFLAFKDSNSKIKRYISYTCLCIGAVTKIYPVLFGLYLLRDKKYKAVYYCIILSLLLTFIPFLYFAHGFDNIPKLLNNLHESTEVYGALNVVPRFGIIYAILPIFRYFNITIMPIESLILPCKLLSYILSFLSVIVFLLAKNSWKSLTLLSISILMIPAHSWLYCGLYLLPCLLLFLQHPHKDKFDLFYLVTFLAVICPVQFVIHNTPINYIIFNFLLYILWIILLATMFLDYKEILYPRILSYKNGCKYRQ